MKMTQVAIGNMKFTPPTVSVKVGECVIWCNGDGQPHTVTDDPPGTTCSGDIASGTSYHREFPEAGTFNYHCERHLQMKGTVTVSVAEKEAPKEEPVKEVPVKATPPVHPAAPAHHGTSPAHYHTAPTHPTDKDEKDKDEKDPKKEAKHPHKPSGK